MSINKTFRVLKFGGTSVGSPENATKVIEIVKTRISQGFNVAVVVSAYTKVTNELIAISQLAATGDTQYRKRLADLEARHIDYAKKLLPSTALRVTLDLITAQLKELEEAVQGVYLLRECSARAKDSIVSYGERLSAITISAAFSASGVPSEPLDARKVVVTDESFGGAKIDFEETNRKIAAHFSQHQSLQVVTGFIGASPKGLTTTLGRGGSDYTGAIFGAALGSDEVEIWTDVDGMMTADPRKVPKAFVLPFVSYEEAFELCHFGAKVIYTPTLKPAMERKIPIRILNTFNPTAPGTLITEKVPPHELPVTGVTSIDEVSLLRVQGPGLVGIVGVASRLFGSLARAQINIILISQASSEHSICIAVSAAESDLAARAINNEFALERERGLIDPAVIERELAIVSVVGENMRRVPGISAKLFGALGRNGVNVVAIAQGSSELNISTVIARRDEEKALVAIHDAFFLTELRTLNVFLAGTGLIGKTLIRQIAEHRDNLKERYLLNVNLVGVANSSRSVVDPNGIDLTTWNEALKGSQTSSGSFTQQVLSSNLSSSVFVDCTASEEMADHYLRLINASIPVVTPNKKAQSGSLSRYNELKRVSRKRNVELLFETSVGAGLPVISTLSDLIRSGDKIIKIEAVLSGTLSFIFNSFSSSDGSEKPFSEVVKQAKALGYTEPDPRDDLNGLDAGRKLLILAREAGNSLELKDISIERFLPEKLFEIPTSDEFMRELPLVDSDLNSRRLAAKKLGKKLSYVGILENGKAALKLIEIDSSHPFYSLSGADNIVSFTTERYRERPLVVKGPGAGAEVTAAGVFADIVRIANYGR